MERFVGVFERQLDVKGRLALPATYRTRLGSNCYLTLGADNSIEILPTDRFDKEADRIEELELLGEISRDQARAFAANAQLIEPDAQGRIYLNDRLRDHAKLEVKGPVVVQGRLSRIEICSVERYLRSMSAGESEYTERAH